MDINSGMVCLIGMGIVFVGLICIVFICMLMSFIVKLFTKSEKSATVAEAKQAVTPAVAPAMPVEEKRAILAGICAVIAEEIGTDASNIRVRSFRRI